MEYEGKRQRKRMLIRQLRQAATKNPLPKSGCCLTSVFGLRDISVFPGISYILAVGSTNDMAKPTYYPPSPY
jgi:hypothetical protein